MFQVGDEVVWTTPHLTSQAKVVHVGKTLFGTTTITIQTEAGTIVDFDGQGKRGKKSASRITKKKLSKLELALK